MYSPPSPCAVETRYNIFIISMIFYLCCPSTNQYYDISMIDLQPINIMMYLWLTSYQSILWCIYDCPIHQYYDVSMIDLLPITIIMYLWLSYPSILWCIHDWPPTNQFYDVSMIDLLPINFMMYLWLSSYQSILWCIYEWPPLWFCYYIQAI